jgi:hypothetical protein
MSSTVKSFKAAPNGMPHRLNSNCPKIAAAAALCPLLLPVEEEVSAAEAAPLLNLMLSQQVPPLL